MYVIISAIITNVFWYLMISKVGEWTAYAGVGLSVVAMMVTWRFAPLSAALQYNNKAIAKAHVISASTTAVVQTLISAFLSPRVGAVMMLMWVTWYALGAVTYAVAKMQQKKGA